MTMGPLKIEIADQSDEGTDFSELRIGGGVDHPERHPGKAFEWPYFYFLASLDILQIFRIPFRTIGEHTFCEDAAGMTPSPGPLGCGDVG